MIALTIAGSDSGGGAGVQADLKTFASLGVHGVCVITSITAQNTLGVREIFDLPVEFIEAQFKAVHEDFEIKAAKTGMLSNREIIKTVTKEIGGYPLVIDPVMIAESGGELLKKDAVETLKEELFPKALITTPNIFEAEVLSGVKITGNEDMKKACKIISNYDCSVIVKGGHLNATDILYHDGKFYEFKAEKLPWRTHGSGCTFASAIAAELAKDNDLITAIGNAKEFITKAILQAYKPGKGAKVVNQFGDLFKLKVMAELKAVIKEIEGSQNFYKLIPEVSTNIVYALQDAKEISEIAGVAGRIVKVGNRVKASGDIEFGASKHVASVVLAAMRFDKGIRSAMNVKYSERAIELFKSRGFKIASFSREEEPEDVSTMEWGATEAFKKLGTTPDVIYDLGAKGKEAMIRVLGKNPREVYGKVKVILGEV